MTAAWGAEGVSHRPFACVRGGGLIGHGVGRRRTATGRFEERAFWLPAVSRERDLENQSPGLLLVCLTWKGFWGQLESAPGTPLGCFCLQI